MTYTFVTLEVSTVAYDEIRAKLDAAGYGHAIQDDGTIDMHGLAIAPTPATTEPAGNCQGDCTWGPRKDGEPIGEECTKCGLVIPF